MTTGDGQAPFLSFVRGQPTDTEIAAVVAVLTARLNGAAPAGGPDQARPVRGEWANRSRQLRRPIAPGPGGWRRSAHPC